MRVDVVRSLCVCPEYRTHTHTHARESKVSTVESQFKLAHTRAHARTHVHMCHVNRREQSVCSAMQFFAMTNGPLSSPTPTNALRAPKRFDALIFGECEKNFEDHPHTHTHRQAPTSHHSSAPNGSRYADLPNASESIRFVGKDADTPWHARTSRRDRCVFDTVCVSVCIWRDAPRGVGWVGLGRQGRSSGLVTVTQQRVHRQRTPPQHNRTHGRAGTRTHTHSRSRSADALDCGF